MGLATGNKVLTQAKTTRLKQLADNNDHLQDRLRRRDEKIKELNEKNLQLSEKLKNISKTQDAFMCIICFDSVSI